MKSILKAMYAPTSFDMLFGILLVLCLILQFQWANIPIPAIEPSDNALTKVAALLGVLIGGCLLATVTTRLDQAMAEDYMFQTLSKSALMGIMGTVFGFVLWGVVFGGTLGRLSSYGTLAALMLCWSISYFIVRIRGTGV